LLAQSGAASLLYHALATSAISNIVRWNTRGLTVSQLQSLYNTLTSVGSEKTIIWNDYVVIWKVLETFWNSLRSYSDYWELGDVEVGILETTFNIGLEETSFSVGILETNLNVEEI